MWTTYSRRMPPRLVRLVGTFGLLSELLGYAFWLMIDLGIAMSGPLRWADPGLVAPIVGVLLAMLVLARRWSPRLAQLSAAALGLSVLVTTVTSALGLPGVRISFTEQLALAVLVIAVLRSCSPRLALGVAVAAAVAIVGSPILRMSNGIGTFLAVLSAIGWGGAVAIGLTLRNMAILRSATEEEVRSAERMELARELHDVVAHHVTGIVVQAQAARVVIPHQPAVINEALIAIERAGEDALSAMRRMVGVLRDQAALRAGDDTSRNPGTALVDITDLAQRFDANSGLVTLRLSDEAATLAAPPGVAMTAYRVVQEALTNVRRHAPEANWVWIELAVDPAVEGHQLTVSVRNDGVVGGNRSFGGGYGLVGMAERVAALGGDLHAAPGPDHTWVVTARLPLTAKRGWT